MKLKHTKLIQDVDGKWLFVQDGEVIKLLFANDTHFDTRDDALVAACHAGWKVSGTGYCDRPSSRRLIEG